LALAAMRAGAVSLVVADADGAPGETVYVAVQIETDGLQLGSVRNDISFEFPQLSVNYRGVTPDCFLAAGVGRQLDIGLADGGARLRAAVTPIFPSGTIRDGMLYTCGFTVSPQAPTGVYSLAVSGLEVELMDGTPIAKPVAEEGSITVRPPDSVVIGAAQESGFAGGLVTVPVLLAANGRRVAATVNAVNFNRAVLRLHRNGGQPDCAVNPLLGKLFSVFVPADGDSLLAQVLPEPGVDPMEDGELYRCTFEINPQAPIGSTTLEVANVAAFDPEGVELVGVIGANGAVIVEAGLPCAGDCDDDGAVTVDELVRAVNIALGLDEVESCPSLDRDLNQVVTVEELVAAVGDALMGC